MLSVAEWAHIAVERTMLNVTTQFGITGHTPDFRIITILPSEFEIFSLRAAVLRSGEDIALQARR
jgi:hypothetical protein